MGSATHIITCCPSVGIAEALSGLLKHLSQKSLEGEALKWNSSLPQHALRSFDDVIDRFTSQ